MLLNYRSADTYGLDLRVKDFVAVLIGQHVGARVALAFPDQEHAVSNITENLVRIPRVTANIYTVVSVSTLI